MSKQRLHIGLTLGSSCLLALGWNTDLLEFHVAEGTSLTKSFRSTSTGRLEDMVLEVDGNDVGELLGDFEIESETTSLLVFTDEYQTVAPERVTRLARSFDGLESSTSFSFSSQFGGESQDVDVVSPLDGHEVVFLWDEDSGAYACSFAEEQDADEEDLRSLEFETDMRFLLPPDGVEEGDTWKVPLIGFTELLTPGGDLLWMPEEMPEMDMEAFEEFGDEIKKRAEQLIHESLKGEALCTYLGSKQIDGQHIGEFQVQMDLDLDLDLVPMVEEIMESIGDLIPMDVDLELDFETLSLALSIESEGHAAWNMGAGHFQSLTLETDMDFTIEVSMTGESDGQSHSVNMLMDMTSVMENEVQFSE